jgi:ABC-2 type transport system ATP-binding protein
VLFCSHLLSEVEQLCDRVAILNQGRMLYSGRWQDLATKGERFRINAEPWDKASVQLDGARIVSTDAGGAVIELPPGADIADIIARLVGAGVRVRAVEPERQTLERLYLDQVHKP